MIGNVVLDDVVFPPLSLCSSSSSFMDGSRGALEIEEHFCRAGTFTLGIVGGCCCCSAALAANLAELGT